MNKKPYSKNPLGSKSKAGGIAVIVLAGIYSLVAPQLNTRFGWDLPAISADAQGNVRLAEKDSSRTGEPSSGDRSSTGKTSGTYQPSDSSKTKSPAKSKPSDGKEIEGQTDDLLHGLLKEVSSNRYQSPEGLLYTPGSAEGHRLNHLERHTKDMPSRPGSHGVFDGEMAGALKTIDRAYQRAKKNQKTTKKVDDGRTIYTVDMGGRVGYVGGRDGKRRRNPMARRVRIVLDGNRVITAYPM
ncbi:hypothetical protein LF1_43830 [Rubripirellula obstinata]|uniref:Uncharacterized protein n=1 Tax=Rubripirellula obstinata TaxID=406547 RepID=A0A5B1CR15_9BACT|nr:hypothetical protein [Rubripirellula obstinata]KAA1261823.1 hypothetical protein LF1_43830 [Rubripirellula obstinata]